MAQQAKQFLRLKHVKARVGLSRTSIYQKIKKGEFPKAYPLGARAVGFLSAEIDEWIDQRVIARGAK